MSTIKHSELSGKSAHHPYRWIVANSNSITSASSKDLYKKAFFTDTNTEGTLVSTDPITFTEAGGSGDVESVNGKTGVVTLDSGDIAERGNLYHTDTRAVSAIQSDPSWNAANWDTAYSWGDHSVAGYASDSNISTVGKTGNYNDLSNKPDLSVLNDTLIYASQTNFPTTGESDKVYIAKDTGYMYRWNGTTYTQLTDQTAIWGEISGTLNNQTDLKNILDSKADNSSLATVATSGSYNDLSNKPVYDNYVSWTVSDGTNSENIGSGNTLAVQGSGASTTSYDSVTNTLTVSSTDTTYSAGTGISLSGTTFSLSDERYTTTEKNKLSGIESGAQANTVDSVNSKTGAVSLSTSDVSEGTNLYYTDARAQGAINVSGDLSYSGGVVSFSETYSTPSEVKTAYESNADTNAFTDSEKTKLGGVESGSDNYSSWTISDGTNSESVASGNTVTITGAGATTATYNPATNTLTIDSVDTNTDTTYSAGTGLSLAGTVFSLSDERYTTTEKNKLSGIESGATTDQTANEILTAIKTVDGIGSGLDADLLDGVHATDFATSAQGSLADSSVQPSDLATVATTGNYNDLSNKPDLSVLNDVLSYTSQANFPVTGETGKVYIAEDTGYVYRWSGSAYVQLTDQTAIWGEVSGTLSNQTDLKNALDAKLDAANAYTSSDFNTDLATKSTNDLSEGTSLYYTDARARGAISVSGDLSYSVSTGVIAFSETYSTASEIKTAYESNLDTNAFTDALQAKLNGIEAGAEANIGTNLGSSGTGASRTITSSTGSNTTITYSASDVGAAPSSHTHTLSEITDSGDLASIDTNASTSNFLRGDGSWVTPPDTTYSDGTGLSLSGTTFNVDNPFNPSGSYSGLRAQATTATDVGLGNVRNVSSYSQTESDGRYVNDTGDSLTGTYTVNTTDDGVNKVQVSGGTRTDTLAAGSVQNAQESIDTDGNVQVRGEGQVKMGDFAMQYNAATQSLDFNWIGG